VMTDSRLPPDLVWFTPADCAATLHISVNRFRQFIQKGLITARVHIGPHGRKQLLISEAALRTFCYEYFTSGYWKGKKRPRDEAKT